MAPKLTIQEARTLEGTFVNATLHEDWTFVRSNGASPITEVWREDNGKLLCVVHRNAIPVDLCKTAVECYTSVAKRGSTNRGVAAGAKHRDRSSNNYEKGVHSNSAIVGYIDHTHYNRPCRLTSYSQKHFEQYERGLPFIQAINDCFQKAVPDAYERQRIEAYKTQYHIANTAFSTVTVNYNFRTAVHRDAGDFDEGFGNLVVCQEDVEGGWLLFPRYRVAVVLDTTDFMAMDVHEWHCNTPIQLQTPNGFRLSFVCYLRHRMKECDKVNQRLEMLSASANAKVDTDTICREIFACVEEELPTKTIIRTTAKGNVWWAYQGRRFHIIYRNRRFLVHDVLKHFTIHNLWPALEYAQQMRSLQDYSNPSQK